MCATFARQSAARSLSSRRGGVEQQDGLVGDGVGELQERIGGEVRDDEVNALAGPPAHRLRKLLDARPGLALQQEVRADHLADLLAGRRCRARRRRWRGRAAGAGCARRHSPRCSEGRRRARHSRWGNPAWASRLSAAPLRRRRRPWPEAGRSCACAPHAMHRTSAAASQPARLADLSRHRRGPSGARARPGRTW